jgi:hypothetical protein
MAMTTQQEVLYITRLLPLMARQHWGCEISEVGEGFNTSSSDLASISTKLRAEGLAVANDPRTPLYLAITPRGKQIAEYAGGYAGFLEQEITSTRLKLQQELQKEQEAKTNTRLSTAAAIISAVAAVAAIWVSLSANSSIDKTNAQLDAQAKRIQSLEMLLKQRQRP